MDNLHYSCITDRGLERGLFLAIVYSEGDVHVEKIYSWSDTK